MNNSFLGAMKHYVQAKPDLTHPQAVCRLYRASLRCLASWAVDRGVFNEEATRIQGLFRVNADCSAGKAKRLMREAEEELFGLTHPDKYIPAYMPGGSLFMRNPPLPLSVCYPDGIPEGIEHDFRSGELNPDMTQLTPGEKSAGGRVFIDSANKNML
mmetsp:Transcript_34432/g.63004  ORF Transcript_34432/g.63004 Transcript_34432/m.63004 type:complete len:157 (-) Transcript_34432:129-599(-)